MAYFCPRCHKELPDEDPETTAVSCPGCRAELNLATDDSEFALRTGERVAGFEIIRPIGTGGMGQVYLAKQLSLEREVALKVLPRHFAANYQTLRRFLNEVRNTAAIQHPNVVTVFEAGDDRGICFLAMAYVDGESLDLVLKKAPGALDERRMLEFCRKVAEGLQYAWNKQKLLHRDIKPGNIMVTRRGEVKVLDLGIAKRPGQDDDAGLTQQGMAIGTPYYMSPEQARGEVDLDCRADIYSLGATLYHLVTGTRPFEGNSVVAVLAKQVNEPLPPPRERHPALSRPTAALIEWMMAKAKAERPQDWDAVLEALDRVLRGELPRPGEGGGGADGVGEDYDNDGKRRKRKAAERRHPARRPPGEQAPPPEPGPEKLEAPAGVGAGVTAGDGRSPAAAATAGMPDMQELAGAGLSRWERGRRQRILVLLALLALVLVLLVLVVVVPTPPAGVPAPPAGPSNGTEVVESPPDSPDPIAPAVVPEPGPNSGDERPAAPLGRSELVALVTDAAASGTPPMALADRLLSEDRAADAEGVMELCLVGEPEVIGGAWVLPAARALQERYRDAERWDDYERILRLRLRRRDFGAVDGLAALYEEAVRYFLESGRRQPAAEVLWMGLKENPGGDWAIADACAQQLFRLYQEWDEEGQLRVCLHYCLKNLPETVPARALAARLQQRFEPEIPSAAPPLPDERRLPEAIRARVDALREDLDKAADGFTRGRYLLQIGDVLREAEENEAALEAYREAVDRYGREHDGYIGGEALLRSVIIEGRRGRPSDQAKLLNELLDGGFFGPEKEQGVRAVEALAAHYTKRRQWPMRNAVWKRLVDEFGRVVPDKAARALFDLAREYEKGKRLMLAREQLMRVGREFPGKEREHALKAAEELRRLRKEYATEFREIVGEEEITGGFPEPLRLGGGDEYLAVRERSTRLSRAESVTVECWVWWEGGAGSQYLLSRYGGNQRGFNLLLEYGRPRWEVYDGKERVLIQARSQLKPKQWVHLAATAGNGRSTLFVNGVAEVRAPIATINNDGAGHLRVGRCSWRTEGYFGGALQNVVVYPKVIYTGNFKPLPWPNRVAEAVICISVKDGAVRERCGNRIERHGTR